MKSLIDVGALCAIHFESDEYYTINLTPVGGGPDVTLKEGDTVIVTNVLYAGRDHDFPEFAHIMWGNAIYDIDILFLRPIDVDVTRT